MAEQAEVKSSALDSVKLLVSLALLVVAIGAFYVYEDESLLYRVLGLLAVVGVSVAIALTTASGRMVSGFLRDSRGEVRKIVWPTRQETTQTTLMVLVLVILIGIFLWLIDMFLGWAIGALIGG